MREHGRSIGSLSGAERDQRDITRMAEDSRVPITDGTVQRYRNADGPTTFPSCDGFESPGPRSRHTIREVWALLRS